MCSVQCHSGANERLQRLFINLVALMEIDGTPGVAFEAGIEEGLKGPPTRPFAKVIFTTFLYVSSVQMIPVRPHRNPSPLPLLDRFGSGPA